LTNRKYEGLVELMTGKTISYTMKETKEEPTEKDQREEDEEHNRNTT